MGIESLVGLVARINPMALQQESRDRFLNLQTLPPYNPYNQDD